MIEISSEEKLTGETLHDDLVLLAGADVVLSGIYSGDIFVFKGSKLTIIGRVVGSVVGSAADITLAPGAMIEKGFSFISNTYPSNKRSLNGEMGSLISSDNDHLCEAIKKYGELLNSDE